MRNFKLTIEYDGANFSGWQTQAPGLRTVQNHLEEKMQRIFKSKVHCHASGRTDQGAHATAQTAHVKADTDLKPEVIQRALNAFLDRDVAIVKVEEAPLGFHAQRDVKTKTYRYTILNRPSPSALWRTRAFFYPDKLNVTAMRKAAAAFTGKQDFKAYQSKSQRSKIKNTVRTVDSITISKQGEFIHITITADGFLYQMVRNIVGKLISVGSGGKIAAKTVPSHGLCLIAVRY